MFGRLEWAALFEPTIQLLENGYKIEKSVAKAIERYEELMRTDANWR